MLKTIFITRIMRMKDVDGFLVAAANQVQLASAVAGNREMKMQCLLRSEHLIIDFAVSTNNLIATTHKNVNVYIWDYQTAETAFGSSNSQTTHLRKLGDHQGGAQQLLFHDAHAQLITLSKDHTIRVFCTRTFSMIQRIGGLSNYQTFVVDSVAGQTVLLAAAERLYVHPLITDGFRVGRHLDQLLGNPRSSLCQPLA